MIVFEFLFMNQNPNLLVNFIIFQNFF